MAFSESATVAQIAAACPAAATALEKFGIDYSIDGTRSLGDACRDKGIDAAAVIAAIEPDWTTAPLSDLIAHILATHHEYLRRELPVMSQQLARVAEVYCEREPQIMSELPGVFQALYDELALHMRKEEMMLFPTIAAYEAAVATARPLPPTPFGSVANPIRMMEYEHANADNALERMHELTSGYRIPPYACVTYTALMEGLRTLETDLRQHIHLENDILFPRALRLEQARAAGA